MLLGHAGLLDGRRATTHWRSLDWMRESFPQVTVERALHVVEDGHVVTSAGISAGIDMALRVVARYHGEAIGASHRATDGISLTRTTTDGASERPRGDGAIDRSERDPL